jgi:L-ascorbate metabolism protein UlaG (beta-lactamase superfamily)
MTPEEAGQLHLDLRGQLLVPLHWATFDMALHPWYEPIERLVTFSEKESITLIAPEVGEKVDLSGRIDTNHYQYIHPGLPALCLDLAYLDK